MSLQLVRSALAVTEPVPGQHTWPLQVVATSTTTGLPSEIFVYHAALDDDPIQGDIFECVASIHQLDEIGLTPVEDTGDGVSIPYYRSATLLFNCRSPEEAEDLWVKVQADALDLLNNVKSLDTLVDIETIILT